MNILPLPCSLAKFRVELLEAALKRFQFQPFAAGTCILRSQPFQVVADQSRHSRIPINCDFPDFLDQFVIESECNIHVPIIRETFKGKGLCERPSPI